MEKMEKMEKKTLNLVVKKPSEFSLEERKIIIEEWLSSGKPKSEIWKKYVGVSEEHGNILRWMYQLNYALPPKRTIFKGLNTTTMIRSQSDNTPEIVQMQEKIKQLKQALITSELRATALNTMIEVTEKELEISIRKKSFTKQSSK